MPTVHLQLAITFSEDAVETLANLFERSFRRHLSPVATPSPVSAPSDAPRLLLDSRQAAKMLKVSSRTLWKMQNSGEMPPPIRMGRSVRWNLGVLKKWVDEGCPRLGE